MGLDVASQGEELEAGCKEQLDEIFGKLSQLDILILMKKYGFLSEEICRLEACDFVITPIF